MRLCTSHRLSVAAIAADARREPTRAACGSHERVQSYQCDQAEYDAAYSPSRRVVTEDLDPRRDDQLHELGMLGVRVVAERRVVVVRANGRVDVIDHARRVDVVGLVEDERVRRGRLARARARLFEVDHAQRKRHDEDQAERDDRRDRVGERALARRDPSTMPLRPSLEAVAHSPEATIGRRARFACSAVCGRRRTSAAALRALTKTRSSPPKPNGRHHSRVARRRNHLAAARPRSPRAAASSHWLCWCASSRAPQRAGRRDFRWLQAERTKARD